MSLTAFLKNNADVRENFKRQFGKPPFKVERDLLAPPLTKHYTTIGTAFDYLLRFYIKHLNPKTIDKGYWVAEIALGLLKDEPLLYAKAKRVISEAKAREAKFLETGQITDALIESALSLAYLDPIYRANRGHAYIGIPVDRQDIDDVRQLISIVAPEHFKSTNLCLVNPTFGIGSVMVGGADADIIIDDNIIDIKTTKKLELRLRDFQQVIGYYVLHQIGGLDCVQPKPCIKKISIYFSRYGYLHTIALENIINEDTFPYFIEWFKERAQQEYGIVPQKTIKMSIQRKARPISVAGDAASPLIATALRAQIGLLLKGLAPHPPRA